MPQEIMLYSVWFLAGLSIAYFLLLFFRRHHGKTVRLADQSIENIDLRIPEEELLGETAQKVVKVSAGEAEQSWWEKPLKDRHQRPVSRRLRKVDPEQLFLSDLEPQIFNS